MEFLDKIYRTQPLLKDHLKELQKHIQYYFRKPVFLLQAVLHKSYIDFLIETDSRFQAFLLDSPLVRADFCHIVSYERYEFFGDSILDMVITDYLCQTFPHEKEGLLTKIRAKIVDQFSLIRLGQVFRLEDYILVDKKQRQTSFIRPMIAHCLEAIIAAVYMDRGFKYVEKFILTLFSHILRDPNILDFPMEDYRSTLQEWSQKHHQIAPSYEVISSEGSDHQPVFRVEVRIDEKKIATANGPSKKMAAQNAAREAILIFNKQSL